MNVLNKVSESLYYRKWQIYNIFHFAIQDNKHFHAQESVPAHNGQLINQ